VERYPLRLGESVFVRHRFSEEIFKKAAKPSAFRELMDEFGVTRLSRGSQSATREARNRKAFVRGIKQKSGIRLEVISAAEESRLGRKRCWPRWDRSAAPMYRGPKRRKPGNQYPAGPHRSSRRALAGGHGCD